MKWKTPVRLAAVAMIVALGHASASAWAAGVDLSDSPLVSGVSKPTPPNIYFILDDSTSMSWDYMPDDVNDGQLQDCFRNSPSTTRSAYDPSVTDLLNAADRRRTSRMALLPDAVFTAAKDDGYGVTSSGHDHRRAGVDTSEPGQQPVLHVTNGSYDVTVPHTSHGYRVGSQRHLCRRFELVTVNGVTGSHGAYTIESVIDANTYTITAGNKANGVARALGNAPFMTTTPAATRRTVTVTDNGHGRLAGSTVTFSGVSGGGTVRGVTGLNGTFTIVTVVDANRYTITVAAPGATSAGTGGGAAATATYPNGRWQRQCQATIRTPLLRVHQQPGLPVDDLLGEHRTPRSSCSPRRRRRRPISPTGTVSTARAST